MKTALAILAILFLSGCFGSTAKYAAKAVNGYCETISQTKRMELRAEVAEKIHPHSIAIDCAGD